MCYFSTVMILLLWHVLSAAVPPPPIWSNPAIVNTIAIDGKNRYWVETSVSGVTFRFWFIDIADAGGQGKVDLGTRVQYSVRSKLPYLGAQAATSVGHIGAATGPFEFHPEGQNIWASDKKQRGYRVADIDYTIPRPLYLLTDGVESIISGVRPWEFHLDALEIFMGEKPAAVLDSISPNYIADAAANNATVSGAVLRPMTATLNKSYWMLESELSMKQWDTIMGSQPTNWPIALSTAGYANYPYDANSDNPVVFISTKDADNFIIAFNTALSTTDAIIPSEAEWEYACRIPNRDIATSSNAAKKRGWSDQDMPFGFGMHLYDPMRFYYAEIPDTTTSWTQKGKWPTERWKMQRRPTLTDSFYSIFDVRYTFSYNLPDFMPSPGDPDTIDGTSHYIRGYANREKNFPIAPGSDPANLIQDAKQNAWGLLHIHGNVGEMVRDIWDGAAPHHVLHSSTGLLNYFVDMSGGPSWKMLYRPVKGGSWMSGGSQCRASARGRLLLYDLTKYPFMGSDGIIDSSKPDPRCVTDTVGLRPIIYAP